MTRAFAVLIGLFLIAVWISGLTLHSQTWLTWLNGAGGVIALMLGVPGRGERTRGGTSGLLSLGLFALWIIGLVTQAQAWLVWCTFAAACAAAVLALGSGRTARPLRPA